MLEATHYESILDDQEIHPEPCPVCTGDEDAQPCTEECANLMRRVAIERGVRGLYQRCRTALGLVRVYREEGATHDDERVMECMTTVKVYRNSIRWMRVALRGT